MFRDQMVSAAGGMIVVLVLVHAILLIFAFAGNPELFWILIMSAAFLMLALAQVKAKKYLARKFFSLRHKVFKSHLPENLSVLIGNDQCAKPFRLSVLNIIDEKQNEKAGYQLPEKHDPETAAGKENKNHTCALAGGGLVLRVGRLYSDYKMPGGSFDSDRFKKRAAMRDIKMIELELAPGFKMDTNGTGNAVFYDAEGMIHFVEMLRGLAHGKPIGLSVAITNKKEFNEICYSIRKTHIIPDFIVVREMKAGKQSMPIYEALSFVGKTLQLYGLQKHVKIIAFSVISSGLDIVKLLALGARSVYTVPAAKPDIKRYQMPGPGKPAYRREPDVAEFHRNMLNATVQIMEACGVENVQEITISKFFKWLDVFQAGNRPSQLQQW